MTFKYDQTANPKRPVRFDRMLIRTLRVEEKLALSYAMSQSSKLFVFEYKVLQSLEKTRFLPKELAMKGEIRYNKKRLNKIIGQLFVEQTEVNLFSSILDSPDFLWVSLHTHIHTHIHTALHKQHIHSTRTLAHTHTPPPSPPSPHRTTTSSCLRTSTCAHTSRWRTACSCSTAD
jgi:hypothetical protein